MENGVIKGKIIDYFALEGGGGGGGRLGEGWKKVIIYFHSLAVKQSKSILVVALYFTQPFFL